MGMQKHLLSSGRSRRWYQDVTAPCWTYLEQHQGNIQGCFSLLSLRRFQEVEKNKMLG